MKTLFILLILLIPVLAFSSATDIYYAQANLGSATGSDCADALAYTGFSSAANWGSGASQIGSGTTAHICGTISIPLNNGKSFTFQGSGTSTQPITLKWEPGAVITGPGFGSDVVWGNGYSYLVFDGNYTDPSITATANGDNMANQVASGGIGAQPCNGCEFKNLTITNQYVHVAGGSTNSNSVGIEVWGSNYKIHDNHFDHAFGGVLVSYQDGDTNAQIYGNMFDHFNFGILFSANGSQHVSGISIHDNHFLNSDNWDKGDTFHHDGVFLVGNDCINNSVSGKVYNNLFDGHQGASATAWIYENCGMHGVYNFNNVFVMDTLAGGYAFISGLVSTDSNIYFLNNTIVNANGSQPGCSKALDQSGLIWENNALLGCYTYWTATGTLSGTVDYNAFDGSILTNSHAMQWPPLGVANTWAIYRQYVPGNDSHSITPTSFGLDNLYRPVTGSALLGAGINLSSLNIPELSTDKAGISRPSTGSWDIGAFQ